MKEVLLYVDEFGVEMCGSNWRRKNVLFISFLFYFHQKKIDGKLKIFIRKITILFFQEGSKMVSYITNLLS